MKPRVVFFSASEIALPCLEFLQHEPTITLYGILTQPARAKGRGHMQTANPIALWAQEHQIPFYPAKTLDDAAFHWLQSVQPSLGIVFSFGHRLPQRFLTIPPLGMWNLHTSLLPKYRGASPIQTALLQGDRETGVTLMSMIEALDAGPWLMQKTVPIAPTDTTLTLTQTLAQASAECLQTSLPRLLSRSYTLIPQEESQATFCKKITKMDGCLDFSQPAIELERRIRAFQPWPGAYFFQKNERLLVLQAHVLDMTDRSLTPGTFFTDPHQKTLQVGTGKGILVIDRIQKAGKKPMSSAEFLRGNRTFLATAENRRLGSTKEKFSLL